MTDGAIRAEGLVKEYPGGVRALDGLDLTVEAGTIFGLLGPNGAGKTTAVRILTTLGRADEGSAAIFGHDVVRDAGDVRRLIGCVAQKSGIDPELKVRENLMLQGRLYGMGPELPARVDELLATLRLTDLAGRIAGKLSGGQQRRVDLALGMVHRPRLLFLDEPTTGLDPEVRAELWVEIARLRDQEGLTILLTTHYLEEADQLAGSIAIMDRGRVVVEGPPAELKAGLQGDGIFVELRDSATEEAVRGALAGIEGLRDVGLDGRQLRARADDGGRAVPEVLAALERRGLPAASVTASRPSLDDVYLAHTGRSFAEAEAA